MEFLPKSDLHRHLEGSVRLATILEIGERYELGLPGSTLDTLRPHVIITDREASLVEFLKKFEWMVGILVTADICRRVAREAVEDAASERIDYLELRFSPAFMAAPHGLSAEAICEAVVDGAATAARESGITVRLIGILSRNLGVDATRAELDALLTVREHLVAVDLAGDEANFPPEWFESHFRRVRDAGLGVTIHAGEAGGAAGVRCAIERLGATRIGHGVRAIDDPSVIDLLGERRIGIECNLTSNLQTSTVPDLASHPLRKFLELGLLATINTDDPVISGIDLDHELEIAAPAAGLTPDQILQARRNAAAIAFAP